MVQSNLRAYRGTVCTVIKTGFINMGMVLDTKDYQVDQRTSSNMIQLDTRHIKPSINTCLFKRGNQKNEAKVGCLRVMIVQRLSSWRPGSSPYAYWVWESSLSFDSIRSDIHTMILTNSMTATPQTIFTTTTKSNMLSTKSMDRKYQLRMTKI